MLQLAIQAEYKEHKYLQLQLLIWDLKFTPILLY
jgi:hypothetical protein